MGKQLKRRASESGEQFLERVRTQMAQNGFTHADWGNGQLCAFCMDSGERDDSVELTQGGWCYNCDDELAR